MVRFICALRMKVSQRFADASIYISGCFSYVTFLALQTVYIIIQAFDVLLGLFFMLNRSLILGVFVMISEIWIRSLISNLVDSVRG